MVRRHQIAARLAAAFTVVAAAGGCSHLHVKLAVMDQEKVQELVAKYDNQPLIVAARTGNYAVMYAAVAEICEPYSKGRAKAYRIDIEAARAALPKLPEAQRTDHAALLEALEAEATKIEADKAVGCVQADNKADGGFIDVRALKTAFEGMAQPAATTAQVNTRNESIFAYRRILEQGRLDALADLRTIGAPTSASVAKTLPEGAKSDATRNQLGDAAAQATEAAAAAGNAIAASATRAGFLGSSGRTLTLSELAHQAVQSYSEKKESGAAKSPREQFWAEEFNVASGRGIGGASDMVMKLTDEADFSVKGLTFDARATALAVRKLTNSTIQILASGFGMGFTTPAPSEQDPNATTVIPTTDITKAKAKVDAAVTAERNFRASIKALAATYILAGEESTATGATGEAASAARGRAKATFDALKSSLSTPKGS